MIKSTITTETATAIYKSKLILIIPAVLLGLALSMYQSYGILEDFFLVFGVVLPITIVLTGLAGFSGVKLGMKYLLNTAYTLDDQQLTMERTSNRQIKSIDLANIKKIKENWMGLTILGDGHRIEIPKQLPKFERFKEELQNMITNKNL